MRLVDFHISMYRSDREVTYEKLNRMIKVNNLEDLITLGDALFGKEKENRLLKT